MWFNFWAVTIALAVAFSVMAQVIQIKDNGATLGR